MARYKKVCLRCGTPFGTDSARRKYCYGSCSYDAILERRPVNNQNRRIREKNRERVKKHLRNRSPLAAVDREAREAGMTYGQYVAWQQCQAEIAIRQEERKQGIRFLDRFIIREECNNGELQQGASGV